MDALPTIMLGLIFIVGTLLGGLTSAWWMSRRNRSYKMPLPDLWPVKGRPLVNTNELDVWHRLKSIFHDHVVVVKVPVLRFTQLRETPASTFTGRTGILNNVHLQTEEWLDMLGKLYSTFAVCTMDGKVIGCVDVIEPHGGTTTGHELKEALLLECGIAYIALNVFNFPDADTLRELFLGEQPVLAKVEQMTRGGDSDFYAEMISFSKQPTKQVN